MPATKVSEPLQLITFSGSKALVRDGSRAKVAAGRLLLSCLYFSCQRRGTCTDICMFHFR